jgi:hypothetical protein
MGIYPRFSAVGAAEWSVRLHCSFREMPKHLQRQPLQPHLMLKIIYYLDTETARCMDRMGFDSSVKSRYEGSPCYDVDKNPIPYTEWKDTISNFNYQFTDSLEPIQATRVV